MSIQFNEKTGIVNAPWPTIDRPPDPNLGQMGFNTTIDNLETWNGVKWASQDNSNIGSGTVSRVTGNGSISGISLSGNVTSSGNLTLSGLLDLTIAPAIGSNVPNIGIFSSVSSSNGLGVISGLVDFTGSTGNAGQVLRSTGLTTQWIKAPWIELSSPPRIGNTTPNTGAFTNLSVTGTIKDVFNSPGGYGQFLTSTGNGIRWKTSAGNVGPTGPENSIQYNAFGDFSGDINLLWDPSSSTVTVGSNGISGTVRTGTIKSSLNSPLYLNAGQDTAGSESPGISIMCPNIANTNTGGAIVIRAGSGGNLSPGGNVSISTGIGGADNIGDIALSSGNSLVSPGSVDIRANGGNLAIVGNTITIDAGISGIINIGNTVDANNANNTGIKRTYIGNLNLGNASNLIIGGGSNGSILLSQGNSNVIVWGTRNPSLGEKPQAWYNMKPYRKINTTYTNTTGSPISVSIGVLAYTFAYPELTVDGVTVGVCGGSLNYEVIWAGELTAIVPDGSTYSLGGQTELGGSISINAWAELRKSTGTGKPTLVGSIPTPNINMRSMGYAFTSDTLFAAGEGVDGTPSQLVMYSADSGSGNLVYIQSSNIAVPYGTTISSTDQVFSMVGFGRQINGWSSSGGSLGNVSSIFLPNYQSAKNLAPQPNSSMVWIPASAGYASTALMGFTYGGNGFQFTAYAAAPTGACLDICFSPDGQNAYVTCRGNVLVYNASVPGQLTLQQEALGNGTVGVFATADGNSVYTTNYLSQSVGMYSRDSSGALTSQGEVFFTLPLPYTNVGSPTGISFSPDGTLAYVMVTIKTIPYSSILFQLTRDPVTSVLTIQGNSNIIPGGIGQSQGYYFDSLTINRDGSFLYYVSPVTQEIQIWAPGSP